MPERAKRERYGALPVGIRPDDMWTAEQAAAYLEIPVQGLLALAGAGGLVAPPGLRFWRVRELCEFRPRPISGPFSRPKSCPGVYFAVAGDFVKIGYSSDCRVRIRDIRAMCPLPVRLVRLEPGGYPDETRFHKRFRECHDHDEWFRLEGALKEFLDGV